MPDKVERIIKGLGILNKDVNNKLVLTVLLGKICSLVVVSSLPAHGDGCVKIELEVSGRLDEFLQLVHVLELGIAVQQQGGMIRCRFATLMKLLEILDKVMYPLRVQELSDNLRWFCSIDRLDILGHSLVVVPFLIKVVAIFSEDDTLLMCVHAGFLSQLNGKGIEISLVEHVKSLLQ